MFISLTTGSLAHSQTTSEYAIPSTDDGLPGVGPIRRADWFQKLWETRREKWAEQAEADQGAVVFLGDSITQGWGEKLGGAFADTKVANRGISGDTTRGMLVRLEEDVLALNPTGVVLLMGTNDIEEQATPAQICENFAQIIQRLKKHNSKMPIFVCLIFPSSASKSRPAETIKEVNEGYQKTVGGDDQITVIDTWTLFANDTGNAKKEEFPDLLHPNQLGYAKWAKALGPFLQTAGLLSNPEPETSLEEGYERLFNGSDLTGWCLLPTPADQIKARARWQQNNPAAPLWPIVEERQDLSGKASPNKRYQAIDGRLVVTYPAEGRRIEQLWTAREFSTDFTLRLEFRASPNADSGVFLRGKQLQCRDYATAGPYKDLEKYKPQDWNELTVVVKGNSASCYCNGELLESDFQIPASGPIGLEGDRGQMEYRNIRISAME